MAPLFHLTLAINYTHQKVFMRLIQIDRLRVKRWELQVEKMVWANPHFYQFYCQRNDQLKNASQDFYSRNNISFNRAIKIPASVQKYGIEPWKRGDKLQLLQLVLGIGQVRAPRTCFFNAPAAARFDHET